MLNIQGRADGLPNSGQATAMLCGTDRLAVGACHLPSVCRPGCTWTGSCVPSTASYPLRR